MVRDGVEPHPGPVQRALADGVVDAAAATIEEASATLTSHPRGAAVDLPRDGGPLAGRFEAHWARTGTVTDVASAKSRIVAGPTPEAALIGVIRCREGIERVRRGLPDLFVQRPWVTVLGQYARLCDGERIGELIEACGALQVPMHAAAHDSAVAAISHMPLIVSAAMVEAVAGGPGEPEHEDWRAAECWRHRLGRDDRLAKGEPGMGAASRRRMRGDRQASERAAQGSRPVDQGIGTRRRPDAEVLWLASSPRNSA